MRRSWWLAGVILLAGTARADVRIVNDNTGSPTLVVRPGLRGPWTPVAGIDATTVNPQGDIRGDGYPGHAASLGRSVAAWHRPASECLVLLDVAAGGARNEACVRLDAAMAGTPQVAAVGTDWIVAWQEAGSRQRVVGLGVSDLGQSAVTPLASGQLVDLVKVGRTLHVVSYLPGSGEVEVTTLIVYHQPVPIPIPAVVSRLFLRLDSGRTWTGSSSGGYPATWSPCIKADGVSATITWQAAGLVVGTIRLDEAGVASGPDFARGRHSAPCGGVLTAPSTP